MKMAACGRKAGRATMLIPAISALFALPAVAQTTLPEVVVTDRRGTPLNTESPADSASFLGLTPRETPATVEVIDKETIRARGYRSVTDAVQGAVGVTAGDAPGAPANFSMRGYSFRQVNTLYNGIKTGPSSMTSRVMDTGNLDRIEFLKGPASLMSGEGATGGAINYVTRHRTRGRSKTKLTCPTARSIRYAPGSARAAARRYRDSTTASTSTARRPAASSTTPTARTGTFPPRWTFG